MSYKGLVKNGVVVLEPGAKIPDGTEVRVEAITLTPKRRSLLERLQTAVGKAKTLPPDAARNIDRDLYGLPPR